jgi:peroxiredoxin
MTTVKVGTPAPDIDINTADEQTIKLSSLWARGPLMVNFLRHFG